MNLANAFHLKRFWLKAPAGSASRERAFTRIDLLFILVPLALLALIVLPAVADIQNKGGRADCANNLRQIGQDSMIYASENNGWLPMCTLGGANGGGSKTNFLGGEHYARYVYLGGPPNTQVTTNEPPIKGAGYQNLGWLYQAGLAGNGGIFYCPAAADPGISPQYYQPLLTADSTGSIRSSYLYNPRIVNPNGSSFLRRYQKTSDLEPHKLFAVDYLASAGAGAGIDPGSSSIGLNALMNQHIRDRGWNVLFTDGAVQFSRLSNQVYQLVIQNLVTAESTVSLQGYDQTFNVLELDH